MFGLENPIHDSNGNILLQVLPIDINCCTSLKSLFLSLVKEIELRSYTYSHRYKFANRKPKSINEESEDILFRIVHNDADKIFDSRSQKASEEHDDVSFKIFYCKDADSLFDSQSQILVDEIKQRIDALRNRGVNTMFLYDLIDEEPHLSRLLITRDFRIFLVDYNNIEIKLSLLPKAVYFLFLRHLEGIRFKELSDYYSELLKIYRSMNPIGEKSKQEKSIRDITDPTKNSINEKCSRIHEAFVSVFDERLAKYYCVSGNRGEAKRILLDKSMIIWET